MKKILLALALLCTAASAIQAQERLTDKQLVDVIYAMGQMFPDGFTLDLNTMRQPTEGLMVSYKETQNSFDRKSLPAVIRHARAHENLVGGWYNPENGKYYFDSTRLFPEDSLIPALRFAKQNGQYSVFILSKGETISVE